MAYNFTCTAINVSLLNILNILKADIINIYPGVANVGTKPTVTAGESEPPVLCETHIIGYDGDLYGKRIKLDFYRRLRDEKKFSDLDELTRAVKSNIEETKKYFEEKKGKGILYNEKKR